jgi:hypothetical protein
MKRDDNPHDHTAEDCAGGCTYHAANGHDERDERLSPENLVATVNGHNIYRDGDVCHLHTPGVGWWGFDMSEAAARRACESVGAGPLGT